MATEYLDPSKQPPNIIFHDGLVGRQPFISAIRWRDQWIVTPLHHPGIRIVDDEDISRLTHAGCQVGALDECNDVSRTHAFFNCNCF